MPSELTTGLALAFGLLMGGSVGTSNDCFANLGISAEAGWRRFHPSEHVAVQSGTVTVIGKVPDGLHSSIHYVVAAGGVKQAPI